MPTSTATGIVCRRTLFLVLCTVNLSAAVLALMLIEQQACGTPTPPLTNLPDPNSLKQGMHVLYSFASKLPIGLRRQQQELVVSSLQGQAYPAPCRVTLH
jgi:hypothetical protein